MLENKVTEKGLVKYAENPFYEEDLITENYRKVDETEFIKIFTGNIDLIHQLSLSGRKVLDLLMVVLQKTAIKKDRVYLSDTVRKEVLDEIPMDISRATLHRGIRDLVDKKIIARSLNTNVYFINPHVIFNGNRLVYKANSEKGYKYRDNAEVGA